MSSPSRTLSPWRRKRAASTSTHTQEGSQAGLRPQIPADQRSLSSSVASTGFREPIRSFIPGAGRDSLDTHDGTDYARSVREDSAELASYYLGDSKGGSTPRIANRQRKTSTQSLGEPATWSLNDAESADGSYAGPSEVILEVSEPPSPEESALLLGDDDDRPEDSASGNGRASDSHHAMGQTHSARSPHHNDKDESHQQHVDEASEETPLLQARSHTSARSRDKAIDLESQRTPMQTWRAHVGDLLKASFHQTHHAAQLAASPKRWDGRAIFSAVVMAPVRALPAVLVGLILNILDALSYGYILFPLSEPIFAGLGPAGISMFYISTIVSQVVFSTGSVFKGGVGSELIEVVPFFHSMAGTITASIGEDNPDAVISTTIFCFCFSAMITGIVFFTMGALKFGYLVGFIPRHILIGCIGGVGWFLVVTGFEVSARLEGSFKYDLTTLKLLFRADTISLWTIPLGLGIILFMLSSWKRLKDNQYLLPVFICLEPAVFWFFVAVIDALEPDHLRESGWIFEAPPAGEPWWYFYTLFRFDLIHWDAVAECIPAMLALTFFGVLHVPINVPALALQTGEDHADLDKELKLHGLSNFLAGCAGSIQNYLVYANSLFFIKSGGNSRLAGLMLAGFTAVVMVIGPVIIGFIPVMMVGTLIFVLGFELVLNALWDPRKKLNWLEYITVLAIVLIMGIYDFVVGIGVGVLLAFVSLIIQTSRVSAVRATYTGDMVGSTVRRNPSQQHYLHKVGRQIYLVKLAGYLFFGTITSVEGKIRTLLDDEEFDKQPIRYLILDLSQVTGLDYSAAEAFSTMSRLLAAKDIVLVICGVDERSQVGRDLHAIGLGNSSKDTEVIFCQNLNSALESCENELLRTFYTNREAIKTSKPINLAVPAPARPAEDGCEPTYSSSPRQSHLQKAARDTLSQTNLQALTRWQNFREPLRLMLQIFHDLSDKNEDFWMRARDYFTRQTFSQGEILFHEGQPATGFYLVESGILRIDYNLPQGTLFESIMAGTTCGELPFFSETKRTATAVAERDVVVWKMDREGWEKLQRKEPDVAQELLRVGLKLTSERMSSITSYILTTAG